MFERRLKHNGIEFGVYRPDEVVRTIKSGVVMDTCERTKWGFNQVLQVMAGIEKGYIQPGRDVVYWEDFWTPGFEMLPYCQSLKFGPDQKNWVPMYAFCHAQSVDPNDFTAPMAWWMRKFERGIAIALNGVFTAAPELVKMLRYGGIVPYASDKAQAVGTVFDSSVLESIHPFSPRKYADYKTVVFSSRWDKEKDPDFFMSLANYVLQERPDVRFIVCTGQSELKSNDQSLLIRAAKMAETYTNRFVIATSLRKAGYYSILNKAHVQFNCALQDFVSYTLLEAAYYGAAPLYPHRLTFPDALHHNERHLYKTDQFKDVQDAKNKLYELLDSPPDSYTWIYQKYEDSVQRMLQTMGFKVPAVESLHSAMQRGILERVSGHKIEFKGQPAPIGDQVENRDRDSE